MKNDKKKGKDKGTLRPWLVDVSSPMSKNTSVTPSPSNRSNKVARSFTERPKRDSFGTTTAENSLRRRFRSSSDGRGRAPLKALKSMSEKTSPMTRPR